MSLPDFLKEKQQSLESNLKSKKNDFRHKSEMLLLEIKNYNEERYHELTKIFKSRYDKINIQKKLIIGFYGQLSQELKTLKQSDEIKAQTQKFVGEIKTKSDNMKKSVAKKVKDVEEEVEQGVAKIKKVAKEVGKKVEAKVTKKKAAKKIAKKTEKKVTKKIEKKVAEKTVKKTAKKVAKKTAKKVVKKK